ncbi:MAG TPA: hypothetical protein VHE81_20875 [Lacipirellulaceae bacterium]|nr:hypothetical protein [Lacipirellulaceae bacterium]
MAIISALSTAQAADKAETLAQITKRLAAETTAAYDACRFDALSKDYFTRFSRDPDAVPRSGEVMIDSHWRMLVPREVGALGRRMATHLQTFLSDRMGIYVPIESPAEAEITRITTPSLVLLDSGGGDPLVRESFTIRTENDRITVQGDSPNGLRDAIVRLVDRIGLREAPILKPGSTTYKPRLRVRLGAVPYGGSYKDAVFFGFNAVLYGGGDLYALSQSDAIPELAARRVPGLIESQKQGMRELGQYGLKVYAWLNTRQKFRKDDPAFLAHPEIRGALTWSADGEYTLCTSHPLVRRYLKESVAGLFRSLPELAGVVLIVGGEGFYHCHMRPYGVAKGHTNCPRCEKLGAETAVADLCNDLADAARSVRPDAEVVVWPYSAEHVWAADSAASGFLEKLKPGTALLTEIEKSETIVKPGGVQKNIWDYSIDFIGPAKRTQQQIAVCAKHHIPVYLKSEPELGFEAPGLPQIPCMDRWALRAEALASCSADGAWVFPAFRPFYGTSAAEVNKFLWWTPPPDREKLLHDLAQRIAGAQAADHLRDAWKACSEAVAYSPELPPYYTGPYYLGPMHPMCAQRERPLPQVFYGQYLFHAEAKDSEGLTKEPTFLTSPNNNLPAFADLYRKMKDALAQAAADMHDSAPLVDDRHRLTYDAEAWPILWFYHTARTHSNFYESCRLRDALTALSAKPNLSAREKADAMAMLAAWKNVLEDERQNTKQALPLVQHDMRLDPYYGGDHTFSHGAQMIEAKLAILQQEIDDYLPSLAAKFEK